jgi:hypothetical protein
MSVTWTEELILSLAPDASSASNGKALAVIHKWPLLGYNEEVIWGECQGSGDRPYQTRIDLSEPAFKCTCPSRKFPCKHAIGLFLNYATHKSEFKETIPPDWVNEWLSTRKSKQIKKVETKEEKLLDTTAQAKRAQQRYEKVQAGMQDLELWLRDLVRQGLAVAQGYPYSFWDTAAARLVDAQAPGVARLVRQMASIPYSGVGWEERLLAQLGRVYLLVQGFKRLDSLPTGVQADIRTQIGWTQSQEELLTKEGIVDSWLVLGQRVEQEDKLRSQRIWLWGENTQRAALVLNFAYGTQPFDHSLVPGTVINSELVFFESAYPLRAIVKANGEPELIKDIPGYSSISEMIQAYAKALSLNPWLEQFPVAIKNVVPICNPDGTYCNLRSDKYLLPMGNRSHQLWQLLAHSGGYPIDIFGEWDGERFVPLSIWANKFVAL